MVGFKFPAAGQQRKIALAGDHATDQRILAVGYHHLMKPGIFLYHTLHIPFSMRLFAMLNTLLQRV